jgi:hypothetical protein
MRFDFTVYIAQVNYHDHRRFWRVSIRSDYKATGELIARYLVAPVAPVRRGRNPAARIIATGYGWPIRRR